MLPKDVSVRVFLRVSVLLILSKKYEEMETKLSMPFMQNLLATSWFYVINMCGTGIKTFFILLFICYIVDVFIFFPIERSMLS